MRNVNKKSAAVWIVPLMILIISFVLSACAIGNDVVPTVSPSSGGFSTESPDDDVTEPESFSTENPDDDIAGPDSDGRPTYSLTILATNDIHGHFDTLPEYLTIIGRIRDERENVLLLDAGDFFKRGAYEMYRGEIEIDLFNRMGYDALVLGNNEFKVPGVKGAGSLEASDSQIAHIVSWAEFPVLCGNVTRKDSGAYIQGTEPYIVRQIGGLNIGIIGVTNMEPADGNLKMAADKVFVPGHEAVAQLLPAVQQASDIQIVLSHAGILIDSQMENVSAVIGGHDHLKLENFRNAHNIPVTQGRGEAKHRLSRLDLFFVLENNEWVLTDSANTLYSAEDVPKNMALRQVINAYTAVGD